MSYKPIGFMAVCLFDGRDYPLFSSTKSTLYEAQRTSPSILMDEALRAGVVPRNFDSAFFDSGKSAHIDIKFVPIYLEDGQ